MRYTTTRVNVAATALYAAIWASFPLWVNDGNLGAAVLLVILGAFTYFIVLSVTVPDIAARRLEQRRQSSGRPGPRGPVTGQSVPPGRRRALAGPPPGGPGTQVSAPRSRPRVASRSSWNWIHTRWQESRSGASIQAY